jgi:hypothetical protein
MTESDWLAEAFEKNRTRLRAVAYRIRRPSVPEHAPLPQEATRGATRRTPAGPHRRPRRRHRP